MKGRKSHGKRSVEPTAHRPPRARVSRSRLTSWMPGLVLVVVTLAAYLPAARCGFIWDDDDYVENNVTLRSVEGLQRIWFELGATKQYYPLVHTTFWMEYHLWGLRPAGFHLVNMLLHAAGALLLWRILRRLELTGAWLAAVVFALHPVQVESVAWVTERKNVLSGLLYLASAWAYFRFALRGDDESAARSSWKWYALSLALFIGALFSKTVTCSLPAAILLILWWKKGSLRWKKIMPLVPFFTVGIAMALVTAWMEKHHVRAVGGAWDLSIIDRFLIAGRALWFYLEKLVWPANLTFIYPRFEVDAHRWWLYLFPIAWIAIVYVCWRARARLGLGPLTAMLFFSGTLFPALGFIDVYPMRYSFVADHFQYLAAIGPITLGASLFTSWYRRTTRPSQAVGFVAVVCLLSTLGVLSWRQCGVYRDRETLWRDTLRKNPRAWIAHNNLGVILQRKGKNVEAVRHLQRASQLNPDYLEAQLNLGAMLQKLGRRAEAIEHLNRVLEIQPDHVDAHINLGLAMKSMHRLDEASLHLRRAIKINPLSAEAHANLGSILLSQGKLDEAIEHYRKAIALKPGLALAHLGLGQGLTARGDMDEAIISLKKAMALTPRFAPVHLEYGRAMLRVGQPREAKKAFRRALQLNPNLKAARRALESLNETGKRDTSASPLQP